MKLLIACILALLYAYAACAQDMAKPTASDIRVMVKAANRYGIDVQDLVKIGYVESRFKQSATRVNNNGTVDVGMFQINSVHWTKDCKGYDVTTLQGNAYCAAKLIAGHAKHAKTDKNWLGRYHSKTQAKKVEYCNLLARVATIQ